MNNPYDHFQLSWANETLSGNKEIIRPLLKDTTYATYCQARLKSDAKFHFFFFFLLLWHQFYFKIDSKASNVVMAQSKLAAKETNLLQCIYILTRHLGCWDHNPKKSKGSHKCTNKQTNKNSKEKYWGIVIYHLLSQVNIRMMKMSHLHWVTCLGIFYHGICKQGFT